MPRPRSTSLRTLELERAEPDSTADEHYHPAALLAGETGPMLVAFRLAVTQKPPPLFVTHSGAKVGAPPGRPLSAC